MTRDAPGWSTFLGIGAVCAALLVGGLGLGWWLDDLLNTYPILVLVGTALGIAAGIFYTVVQFRNFLDQ